jgi:glycosyltransferase involved in cell wall biosynthesis
MKKQDVRLSVVLAVFNEENNLAECLESVKEIADEIVVVDGGSTDQTIKIAKSFKAIIIETDNPPIFHINKQKALDAARGVWILQLDADERVSVELAKEVRKIVDSDEDELENHDVDPGKYDLLMKHVALIQKRDGRSGLEDGPITAFYVPRRNYFLGKFLMHGGVYPDGTVRLVKKGTAHFELKEVHDQMIIDGRVSTLSNDLIHMADPDFSRYLKRSDRYTTLQAAEWFENFEGKKDNRSRTIPGTDYISRYIWTSIKPCFTFLKIYIRHKGFKDGYPGFVWAKYSGLHISSSYVKYWEMRRRDFNKKKGKKIIF